jgi:hypothetical protein
VHLGYACSVRELKQMSLFVWIGNHILDVIFALFRRRCISVSTLCLTLKLSFVRALSKYKDSMFLTWDKVVYTSPCIHIPVGSKATLSSVSPCDMCIVRAHAS